MRYLKWSFLVCERDVLFCERANENNDEIGKKVLTNECKKQLFFKRGILFLEKKTRRRSQKQFQLMKCNENEQNNKTLNKQTKTSPFEKEMKSWKKRNDYFFSENVSKELNVIKNKSFFVISTKQLFI